VQRVRLQGKKFNAAYIPTPQIEVSWKLPLLVLFALLVVAVEDRLVGCSVLAIILVHLASSAGNEGDGDGDGDDAGGDSSGGSGEEL
jgi:hypothetical protein